MTIEEYREHIEMEREMIEVAESVVIAAQEDISSFKADAVEEFSEFKPGDVLKIGGFATEWTVLSVEIDDELSFGTAAHRYCCDRENHIEQTAVFAATEKLEKIK